MSNLVSNLVSNSVFSSMANLVISLFTNQTLARLNVFSPNIFGSKNTLSTIKHETARDNKQGSVTLVGAGAGDIELLTVKAYRLLQEADVVLYDWLVNPEVLTLLSSNCEALFVGKKAGAHSMSQAEICQLMLQKAQAGNKVVRLKGGDPSIFGRLNEETDILTKHNIPFAIVPGVTAASGCAAYTGIPLTDRACSQSVRLVTAHLKDEGEQPQWPNLASSKDTLVFYMGLNRVEHVANQLMTNGMNPNMPMAIVDKGTSQAQALCCATLNTISNTQQWKSFSGPALIIVGEVVERRHQVDLRLLTSNKNVVVI